MIAISLFYISAEIWLIPSLPTNLKRHLMSCSAQALKLLGNKSDLRISNEQRDKMNGRATPIQMMKYKHSLLLFKLCNDTLQSSEDWVDLNWNQLFNNRSNKVRLFDTSNIRIGKNILSNRLTIMNNEIEFDWLNKSLNSYKLICKLQFLS